MRNIARKNHNATITETVAIAKPTIVSLPVERHVTGPRTAVARPPPPQGDDRRNQPKNRVPSPKGFS